MRSTGLEELDLRSMLDASSRSERETLLKQDMGERAASSDAEEKPDSRYWLDYAYFMIEHEARAVRREYAYALLERLVKLPARIAAWISGRNVQKRLSF
jgi:hypothetical protein